MAKVIIVKPNISQEERKKVLRHTADVMEQIIEEELGLTVKIELIDKKLEQLA